MPHFDRASWELGAFDLQPGYQRLLNTSLSIPFDHTMAELDYHFRQLTLAAGTVGSSKGRISVLRQQLRRAAGLPEDHRSYPFSVSGESMAQYEVMLEIFNSNRRISVHGRSGHRVSPRHRGIRRPEHPGRSRHLRRDVRLAEFRVLVRRSRDQLAAARFLNKVHMLCRTLPADRLRSALIRSERS